MSLDLPSLSAVFKNYPHPEITGSVIGAFYKVYNALGFGFLEKVYHNAMMVELASKKIAFAANVAIEVWYEHFKVGVYVPDLIIEDTIIVEIKAIEYLTSADEAQLLNYLKATNRQVGLLINFGKRPEVRRRIFTENSQQRQS